MMRAPPFRYHAARNVKDAVAALAGEQRAMLLAGGTDLVPNMKRHQQTPALVVGIRHLAPLQRIRAGRGGLTLGACATLSDVAAHPRIARDFAALAQAAGSVATPHLRNMGTLGGNLCLDTRCNYYNQSHEWRQAIDFCMKAPKGTGGHACAAPDGTSICWVATSSPRCWAVSSTDTAPALIALGAEVALLGPGGSRRVPLEALYANDGMAYLTKARDELLTEVAVPPRGEWRSTYWKLRRRGAFDFPVLGVAAAARFAGGGGRRRRGAGSGEPPVVEEIRVVLGAVASCPQLLTEEATLLRGQPLTDERIRDFAEAASMRAKPLDNTDFYHGWRKKVLRSYVVGALEQLRALA
jgi:4-hydroxybenzoyl-CoA reductase subunit beta